MKKDSKSTKIERAIEFATRAHSKHYRKQTKIPYIFHVLNVGKILAEEMECTEDVVVAGILHDTLEDTHVTPKDIIQEFGKNVLTLVEGASEEDKSNTWENRKVQTIAHAKTVPLDVLRIKLADKYDNVKAIRRDYDKIGSKIWDRFNAPKERLNWYYKSLADIFVERFKRKLDARMAKEYRIEVERTFVWTFTSERFQKFMKKLADKTTYFKYDFEDACFKSIPNEGTWVKFKGAAEFKAEKASKLVADAILVHEEITKKEYDNY